MGGEVMTTIHKVLIANRGEIAVRVAKTLRALGIQSVGIYSSADTYALHATMCDESVLVGPPIVAESYLNADRIIEIALARNADAIHPGYGFLSENAPFAQKVLDAGLIWIGPPPKAIASMGDKARAKEHMAAAGVPVAKGYTGEQDIETLKSAAIEVGFPLMIKAVAGGGGRGIRIVHSIEEFEESLKRAQSESLHAFGSAEVMLERYIQNSRHVEIQVFADAFGTAVHLFERDCSLQRRRQKIIEEAPSPAVTAQLRQEMGAAAVLAATSIGYVGAGTVEFLLDSSGAFFFLEMNTRLQVEHPVTEMITGLDLVAWQILVAEGKPLPLAQHDIPMNGHAIEARLYAEDPNNQFLPCTGTVLFWSVPPHTRVDHGVSEQMEISSFYDPMIAKVVSYGADRNEAIRKLKYALRQTVLFGVQTNRSFLVQLLDDDEFVSGEVHTGYVEGLQIEPSSPQNHHWIASAIVACPVQHGWGSRTPPNWTVEFHHGEQKQKMAVSLCSRQTFTLELAGCTHQVQVIYQTDTQIRFAVDGVQHSVTYLKEERQIHLHSAGESFVFSQPNRLLRVDESASNSLRAPMTGRVVQVFTPKPGEPVKVGQTLFVIEAMKMEHPVKAKIDGILQHSTIQVGQQVKTNQLLGTIQPEDEINE